MTHDRLASDAGDEDSGGSVRETHPRRTGGHRQERAGGNVGEIVSDNPRNPPKMEGISYGGKVYVLETDCRANVQHVLSLKKEATDELLALLTDALEFAENYEDVQDRSDGTVQANAAMTLCSTLRDALEKAGVKS